MATHYKEEEIGTPYRSLACSEPGEDQDDPESKTEQGGGLPDGEGEDVPHIPPNLETPNLPPQEPATAGSRARRDRTRPSRTVWRPCRSPWASFMGTMNEMVERLAQREDLLPRRGDQKTAQGSSRRTS